MCIRDRLSPGRTKLRDFYTKLTIQGPTGQSKVVDDLAHVWMAADTIGMCPVDPLDEDYLEAIQPVSYTHLDVYKRQ